MGTSWATRGLKGEESSWVPDAGREISPADFSPARRACFFCSLHLTKASSWRWKADVHKWGAAGRSKRRFGFETSTRSSDNSVALFHCSTVRFARMSAGLASDHHTVSRKSVVASHSSDWSTSRAPDRSLPQSESALSPNPSSPLQSPSERNPSYSPWSAARWSSGSHPSEEAGPGFGCTSPQRRTEM